MKFDKEWKVIVSTLTKEEASAFVKFLQSEVKRHEVDIGQARNLIVRVVNKFNLDVWEE